MKTILITGGNGYIAKSIYSSLHTAYSITTVTRQDFDLLDLHATNQYFKDKYFDIIIHTAGVGGIRLKQEDQTTIEHNLRMYWNLVQNQTHYGKFISFGSGAELGHPTTPYGVSKKAIAESMISKENYLNIRIFAVFDENELDTRFIKSNIIRYINNTPIEVYQNKQMDFFYMPDLISLLVYFLNQEEWRFKQIDCTYLKSHTLMDIATIINNLDEHKVDILVDNKEEKPYVGIYRGLPCRLIGLEQGIKNVYNIIKQNK